MEQYITHGIPLVEGTADELETKIVAELVAKCHELGFNVGPELIRVDVDVDIDEAGERLFMLAIAHFDDDELVDEELEYYSDTEGELEGGVLWF